MRKRPSKHARLIKRLKALVLTASFMATFAGTRRLSQGENDPSAIGVAQPESIVFVIPAGDGSVFLLPESARRQRLQLDPIPQAVRPRMNPVARSQSSR